MEIKEIEAGIAKMSETVSTIKAAAEKSGVDAQKATELANEIKSKIEGFSFVTPEDFKTFGADMQKQFDELATINKKAVAKNESAKSFNEVLNEKMADYFPQGDSKDIKQSNLFKELKSQDAKVRIEMPEVKSFNLLGSLTGDPLATYNVRQAISPSQKINIRDIISTVNTETGLYITFTETSTTNNIAKQAEGSTKGVNAYGLTAVKIVQQYIAGTIDFTKQAMNSLPFITQVLPRLLQRDFFKSENSIFYGELVAGANTSATTAETDKVKKLIDFVAYQQSANYNASVAIVSPADYAALVKSTYSAGYYPGAGSVTFEGNSLKINDCPIVKAAFATGGKVLILDQDYVERVQVSGLAIELSYENNDNFSRNIVTARIECQEEINLMLGAAAQYQTL